MRITVLIFVALSAAVLLAGCAKNPGEGASQTKRVIEASGSRAPDAPRNSVTVLAPPSAPQLMQKQQAKIEADREVTETQLHGLMDRYSDNMRHPVEKAKYQEQIAQQLDTYKRQTLQLYKLQRAAAAGVDPASNDATH